MVSAYDSAVPEAQDDHRAPELELGQAPPLQEELQAAHRHRGIIRREDREEEGESRDVVRRQGIALLQVALEVQKARLKPFTGPTPPWATGQRPPRQPTAQRSPRRPRSRRGSRGQHGRRGRPRRPRLDHQWTPRPRHGHQEQSNVATIVPQEHHAGGVAAKEGPDHVIGLSSCGIRVRVAAKGLGRRPGTTPPCLKRIDISTKRCHVARNRTQHDGFKPSRSLTAQSQAIVPGKPSDQSLTVLYSISMYMCVCVRVCFI